MTQKNKIEPRKLKGFQDHSPEVMNLRWQVLDVIKSVAREGCFLPMATPSLELSEVLLGEGGETDKEVFQFIDNGGRSVGLRYDLTVPLARYVAENTDLVLPFKRLQIGEAWRAEKPQKGRFREFTQCDFDIIGVESLAADMEVIFAILNCFGRIQKFLPIGQFTMSLGHRKVLSALLKQFIPEIFSNQSGESESLVIIDKLEKIGKKSVIELLISKGASSTGATELLDILSSSNKDESYLARFKKVLDHNVDASQALEEIELIVRISKSIGLEKVVPDFSIARGLAYYTGIVFETKLDALPSLGSVSSGGRYDNLVSRFCDRHLPGVGGSIGLDRLVTACVELQKNSEKSTTEERRGIFVALTNSLHLDLAYEVSNYLRNLGKNVYVNLAPSKLSKQFAFANKQNFRIVIVVGEEEYKQKKYSLKNLQTGEQVESYLTLSEISKYL